MATVMGANRAGLQRRNARLDQTQIKHRFKYKQYSWSILTHAHFPLSFGSRFIIFLNLLSWLRVDLYARVLGIKLNSTHKTKKIRGGGEFHFNTMLDLQSKWHHARIRASFCVAGAPFVAG